MTRSYLQGAVYSGTGNTFVLIDQSKTAYDIPSEDIVATCHKENVDGLILVRRPVTSADFQMVYFNRDGSPAGMCGNGIRCLFRYALDFLGWEKDAAIISADGRPYLLQKRLNIISVTIGKVVAKQLNLFFPDKNCYGHLIDSSLPHLVIIVPDVSKIDIEKEAPYFRRHPLLGSHGANVNFVDNENNIRTFERGVEGETLSCGTGIVATAFALQAITKKSYPMQFRVRSQEFLTVEATTKGLSLIGDAHFVRLT